MMMLKCPFMAPLKWSRSTDFKGVYVIYDLKIYHWLRKILLKYSINYVLRSIVIILKN